MEQGRRVGHRRWMVPKRSAATAGFYIAAGNDVDAPAGGPPPTGVTAPVRLIGKPDRADGTAAILTRSSVLKKDARRVNCFTERCVCFEGGVCLAGAVQSDDQNAPTD